MRFRAKPRLPKYIREPYFQGDQARYEVRFAWYPRRVLSGKSDKTHVWVFCEHYLVFQTLSLGYSMILGKMYFWFDRFPIVKEESSEFMNLLTRLK